MKKESEAAHGSGFGVGKEDGDEGNNIEVGGEDGSHSAKPEDGRSGRQ